MAAEITANEEPAWICECCKSAFRGLEEMCARPEPKPYDTESVGHQPDIAALRRSIEQGCVLCKLILGIVQDIHTIKGSRVSADKKLDFDSRYRKFQLHPNDALSLSPIESPEKRGVVRLSVWVWDAEDERNTHGMNFLDEDFWLKITQVQHNVPHLVGREVENLPDLISARSWLDDCLDNHDTCSAEGESSKELPTRLLEITSDEGGNVVDVKLVYSATLPSCTRYAALSHCWGKELPAILTRKENIDQHLKSIDFRTLARNFQDALTTASGLGLRHLWIDSLCIIQQDKEDWEKECVKMASIFQNAIVTIAAAGAPDAHTGFLNTRSIQSGESCTFNLSGEDGQPNLIRARRDKSRKAFLTTEFPPILATRGWVHQERILAPRTLSFGSKQMYFECLTSQRFEEIHVPLGPRLTAETDSMWMIRPPWAGFLVSIARSQDLKEYNRFYDLVRDYSRRRLTYEDDRLPAISGLASRFETYTKDEYLAGLWKSDLLRGLAWLCEEASVMDKNYALRAIPSSEPSLPPPSWSWASCRYPVTWRYAKIYDGTGPWAAKILSTEVEATGPDHFGQVKRGEVHISGLARKGIIARHPALKDLPDGANMSLQENSRTGIIRSNLQLFGNEDKLTGLTWFFDDDPTAEYPLDYRREVVCLVLGASVMVRGEDKYIVWVGLALEGVEGRSNIFRRIGLFQRWTNVDKWLSSASDSLRWISAAARQEMCIV
ncbi:unnamed protein product [Zymoseptoria tritici ST99CH_3D1]|nr:unnamed protein product [Zymoseptoria tritici ST99CH_3D1]